MGKYIKVFDQHSQYETFRDGEDYLIPNVSYCIQEDEVHYNYIDPFKGHEYVDLGLPSGTLWAKMNVGATTEKEAGLYFAWGETQGYAASQVGTDKNFSWSDYTLTEDSGSTMSKYNTTDGKMILDLEDDAAHVSMGGDWHMPNRAQCIELLKETKNGFVTNAGAFTQYAWDDSNGYSSPTQTTATIDNWDTAGYFFFKNTYTSVTDAITAEDYLFIPAAGFCGDGKVNDVGNYGYVWASALNSEGVGNAWFFSFGSDGTGVGDIDRCDGQSVRGVVGETPKLISHTWYEDHLEIVLSKSATNAKLIYQRVQGPDPAPEEITLTSSDGITWTTSELSSQYGHCADITVVVDGIAVGGWSERSGCLS